ncbi:hypothetical protein L211DRAFT_660639 [Terfezia boudieri ATCC MYA-4762]|uniref:Uncharacterized protein n=1 Tax=Terfezia boudieri ATCC MYA-4762 TaxID=1051890 RepID=A0A3N4LVG4_9PEZI|nr:hypothetical protein L211DRAFT_660639 [Terfezia boudieri ATCC MYA-4762]
MELHALQPSPPSGLKLSPPIPNLRPPSLSSRLKRRQRMIRNTPVWVKRHVDVFPWYEEASPKQMPKFPSFSLYWNGYLATLTSPDRSNAVAIVGNENTAKTSPFRFVLSIGHVSTPWKVVMVDCSSILMEKYPTLRYEVQKGIPSLKGDRNTFSPFHFAFHAERVLVGCWLGVPDATSSQGKVWNMIFFVFDLSGNLLSHIYLPQLPHLTTDYILRTSLNTAYLAILTVSERHSSFLRLNIYSLQTCQPVSREIRIKPVVNLQSIIIEGQKDDYLNMSMLLSGFSVDNQGTAWFPSAGWRGKVEFYAQIQDVEFGEEETWVWEMSDFPRSVCGEWVSFPLVEGAGEGMRKRDGIPPKRKEGKEYFDFSTHIEGIVIRRGAVCKQIFTTAILTSSLHDIATIRLLPASTPELTQEEESLVIPKPQPMRIIHGKWKSATTATPRKYTFLKPVDLPLNNKWGIF